MKPPRPPAPRQAMALAKHSTVNRRRAGLGRAVGWKEAVVPLRSDLSRSALKDAHDHSCFPARLDEYWHFRWAGRRPTSSGGCSR
jgi:hypothetical protein